MNLTANFPGEMIRFEGAHTVAIAGLPKGAQIQNATITLTPVAAPGRPLFEEVLTFNGSVGEWGMTKVQQPGVVEVDFHARRTLAAVRGSNLFNSVLVVDLGGGVFMNVNEYGAVAASEDAELYKIPASGALPGLLAGKFRLRPRSPLPLPPWPMLDVTQVTVRTAARNVSLALEGMAPFWVHPGELTTPVTTPDFGDFLQLYLAQAKVSNGRYQLPLIIHSDSLTRLSVTVNIAYTRQQSALPAGVNEVALPYGFDSTAQSGGALMQVTLPVGAEVTAASAQVVGAFAGSRIVFGPVGPLTPVTAVPINGARSQAQPILLEQDTAVTAIDLLLSSVSRAAVLDLNLLADVGGKPFADPLLAAPVALELDRDLTGSPTWVSARLPQEFQFSAGKRYWLVIQARQGEAAWHSQAASTGSSALQQSSTGGLAWRTTQVAGVPGPLAGYFRLRHTPEQFQMPLSLQVSEGETAVPVSLDRFQPLGRIDFTIDFPEFAAAINQAARRAEVFACTRGEQLKNGDFARWSTTGERFGPPQLVEQVSSGMNTMRIAPNGEWALIGDEDRRAAVLALPLHQLAFISSPAPASRQHVAISLDSQRVYLLSEGYESWQLHVLDAERFVPLGAPVFVPDKATCLAISPDGCTLFLGGFAQVAALDTAMLAQLLASGASFSLTDAQTGEPFPLDRSFRPASLAVSPDGRALWVAAAHNETQAGRVYVFDALSHQQLAEPLDAGMNPVDLALTPDGRRALVANSGDDTITLIDAAHLRLERTLFLPKPAGSTLQPLAVEIEPNGRRAFVASRDTGTVSVINLLTLEAGNPVAVGAADNGEIDLAVTPAGDRLYVALQHPYPAPETAGLRYLPLGRQQPDHWTLTTGFVLPVPFTDPFHLTAVLGPVTNEEHEAQPARPSALSQVVPVTAGCHYDFSFWGVANTFDATAEIIWRGGACAVQRTDRIPIQGLTVEPKMPEKIAVMDGAGLTRLSAIRAVNLSKSVRQRLPELHFHRARLQAPPGANQAEIRFLVPPLYNATVDSVSLQATQDAVANGDLLQVRDEALVGWQLSPATATGVALRQVETGMELANLEASPISLVQSFAVTAGQPGVLLLYGRLLNQSASGAVQLRLDWLDGSGNGVGVSTLAIAAGQEEHRLETAVPAAATRAELHLVLPPGVTLSVRHISFTPVELVTVPIHFLAQAPGRLTITGFNVVYDLKDVVLTPPPKEGLCPPTPPGRSASGKPGCCRWCASPCAPCGGDGDARGSAAPTAVTRPIAVTPPRRQAMVVAQPALVKTAVVATPEPPRLVRQPETAVAHLVSAAPIELATRAPQLAALSVPLAAINGIAAARTRILAKEAGIETLPQLAAANPAAIANTLRGVSLTIAQRYVAEAQALVNNPAALPAPLVTCIMPTYDRRPFVPMAIELFLRQDYPNRELIILDDGRDPVRDLVPNNKRIRYLRLPERLSIGAKRNLGGQEARGPLLVSWDDDVWVAPWRLSYQVAALIEYGADVVGLDNILHYDPFTQRAWHAARPAGNLPWMPGSTFCYTRAFWQTNPFPDTQPGEDIRFLRRLPAAKIVPLSANTWLVDIIHGGNVSPRPVESPLWFPYDVAEIHQLMGEDARFYAELAQIMVRPA